MGKTWDDRRKRIEKRECGRGSPEEEESKRLDKSDSGELKLICFFDDSRTPRM